MLLLVEELQFHLAETAANSRLLSRRGSLLHLRTRLLLSDKSCSQFPL